MSLQRWVLALAFLAATSTSMRADIFRWDNGHLIPGTEGITAGPGIQLDHRELVNADLKQLNLTGSRFDDSNLSFACLQLSTLTDATFVYATLTNSNFADANLTRADLTYAKLDSAILTSVHLVDASFINANLHSATLRNSNLTRARFDWADLASADLALTTLTDANLSKADLNNAFLDSANLIRANLTDATLDSATLTSVDLVDVNFRNASLAYAKLAQSTLRGAIVVGADFYATTPRGFTKEQLYSTASYQANDLPGIGLGANNLSGWHFNSQNLTNARFDYANLYDADFSLADTRGAQRMDLTGATSRNTILTDGTIAGLNLLAGDRLAVRNYHGDPARLPPLPPIPITVQSDMTMDDGGVLHVVFDADNWHSTISFESDVSATLGGILALTFAADADVDSQVGATFDVFNWTGTSLAGKFALFSSGTAWDTSMLYSAGDVTYLGLLPGNTNADASVDLADLNNVRNNFGQTGAIVLGDTNGDRTVDLIDLNHVRNNFGASASARPVPEPASLLLILAGATVMLLRRVCEAA